MYQACALTDVQGGTPRKWVSKFSELAEWEISIYYSELKQKKVHSLSWMIFSASWLDGGQFSPAMWSVFELDGSRISKHLEGWHHKFNSIISPRHLNS